MSTKINPGRRIPPISNERLAELMEKIRPVVRFAEGRKGKFQSPSGILHFVDPREPRQESFLREAKPGEKAPRLIEINCVWTYYRYNSPVFFKPTVAEVLAQIQDRPEINRVVAFEVMTNVSTLNSGHHCTQTILYSSAP